MTSIPLAQPAPMVEPAAPVIPIPYQPFVEIVQPAIPSETLRVQAAPGVEPAVVVPFPLRDEFTSPLADPAPSVSSDLYSVEPVSTAYSPFTTSSIVAPAIPSERIQVDPAPLVEPAILLHPQDSPSLPLPSETITAAVVIIEPQFESVAAVTRGTQRTLLQTLLPLIFDERDFVSYGEVLRFIQIQNQTCFVYPEKSNPKPLFTIPLQGRRLFIQKENPKEPHPRSMTISPTSRKGHLNFISVLLTDHRNNLLFQFVFDISGHASIADEFIQVVESILLKR